MKKTIILFILILMSSTVAIAKVDKYSKDYLKNNKHFSIMKPFAENLVEYTIKKSLKSETNSNFDVEFSGYTVESIKKGIFKDFKLNGKDVLINEIPIPFVSIKSLSDYNYIDYTQKPIVYKSDMEFQYELLLSEDSLNFAVKHKEYQKVIEKISNLAYPMFQIYGVSTKIVNNKLYILVEYNFPLANSNKNKVFISSCEFKVIDGKIKTDNIEINSAYGNISINKVANLLNLLNPLEFTLNLLNEKNCNTKIENVKIIDNKLKINGRIIVEGD